MDSSTKIIGLGLVAAVAAGLAAARRSRPRFIEGQGQCHGVFPFREGYVLVMLHGLTFVAPASEKSMFEAFQGKLTPYRVDVSGRRSDGHFYGHIGAAA